jgi:hypothetical protein
VRACVRVNRHGRPTRETYVGGRSRAIEV